MSTITNVARPALLSQTIVNANRAQDRPNLDPNTPNWQLMSIMSNVNYAISVRVAALLSATEVATDLDQTQELIDRFVTDIRTLNAESSAALALMRSKRNTGTVTRIRSAAPSQPTQPAVPTRKLDEFGNPVA